MSLSKLALLVLALCGQSVFAATFVVDSISDTPDTNPGDGTCEATSGGIQCTLRAAIEESNADPGFDLITFSFGLIVINIMDEELPPITGNLTIDARSAPGFNATATNTLGAPPSIYIDGGSLVDPRTMD